MSKFRAGAPCFVYFKVSFKIKTLLCLYKVLGDTFGFVNNSGFTLKFHINSSLQYSHKSDLISFFSVIEL